MWEMCQTAILSLTRMFPSLLSFSLSSSVSPPPPEERPWVSLLEDEINCMKQNQFVIAEAFLELPAPN